MAIELIFAPEVEQDLREAFDWYQERRPGLGEEFLTCVDACIQVICRDPEMQTPIYKEYRRGLLRRFPYSVFYEFSGNTVTVYCVFHNSQDPAKWRRRLL